ncbi:type VI secretion system-associated protein TagF [Paramixta manurensis]|uniref:Type VI secretion system-associated protein TagF n=1 Tax=Paramixta manurensis TaxID=2740817 RepID=A0A6M8UBA4_9GAMM|nr:type VI secretion system-associated protein TagF [Erwiniaceae bacterium PD-1]
MAERLAPGWYGKLPVAGDFLQRRLPDNLVTSWANWFQQGLSDWHHQPAVSTEVFLRAPVWNFVLPPSAGVQRIQMGCLLPSCDRVGRAWPLLALHTFALHEWHPAQLAVSGDWYQALGDTLLRGVRQSLSPDQLEQQLTSLIPLPVPEKQRSAIMDVIGYQDLPCTLSWHEVADRFDPHQFMSYWWSNRSDGFVHATHKHSGSLTAQLFSLLFNPAAGAQPGRNGLYPPMFE